MGPDLVLSSGYLAFAAQAGFLCAVEDAGLEVNGVCGTSSGALAGLLWAAGIPAQQILAELVAAPPLCRVRPHCRPWRGLLTLDPIRETLSHRLPPRLEDFSLAVGVGTRGPDGRHALITTGPAVDAVCASCAVPWLFAPVSLGGEIHADGGAVDRTGLSAWRVHRPGRSVVLHLVARSAGPDSGDDLDELSAVVRSPRSGAHLWSLGNAWDRFERTRTRAAAIFAERSTDHDTSPYRGGGCPPDPTR